jgi:hypothetical protein
MCFISEATSTVFPAHIFILVLGVVALANAIPNMGALTSLGLAGNKIGGYWDASRQEMVATPEGTALCGQLDLTCAYIRYISRPCCYR